MSQLWQTARRRLLASRNPHPPLPPLEHKGSLADSLRSSLRAASYSDRGEAAPQFLASHRCSRPLSHLRWQLPLRRGAFGMRTPTRQSPHPPVGMSEASPSESAF